MILNKIDAKGLYMRKILLADCPHNRIFFKYYYRLFYFLRRSIGPCYDI